MSHPFHEILERLEVKVLGEGAHLPDQPHGIQRRPGEKHAALVAAQSVKLSRDEERNCFGTERIARIPREFVAVDTTSKSMMMCARARERRIRDFTEERDHHLSSPCVVPVRYTCQISGLPRHTQVY